jgi:uncharacterized protein
MNHLRLTIDSDKSFWKYIIVFLKYVLMIGAILIASNTLGALPLITTVFLKSGSNPEILSSITENPNDFSVLGLDPNALLIMMLFPFIAGLLAFVFLVKPLHNRTLKMTINGTEKIRWNRFFISGGVWLVLSGLYLFFYMKFDPSNFVINNKTISLLTLSLISILMIPFQAAFEEVLFRGYLMQGFASLVRNRWFPLIITSVMFGLMHSLNPEVKEFGFWTMMPQYILFGLIFGIITVLDDGIEAAMGAHAANNIFLCIMVTNQAAALQTPALYEQLNIFPWTELAGLFLSGIVFILILKYFFKWESFKPLWGEINIS